MRCAWAGEAFRRFLLPAFAFKAVVIGGGYATGREIAEYFLPSGPRGGLLGIALATVVWSVVAAVTFAFARMTGSLDYRSFFRHLLGRFGVAFEIGYLVFLVLILAVFGAAASAIGTALFAAPAFMGAALLATLIALVATAGNSAVEALFKYVTVFLYAVYVVFFVLCLMRFGGAIARTFAHAPPVGHAWAANGLSYAGYNIIGAVVILPVVRHLTCTRDAIVAGLLCGPIAMLPAALFFVCMLAEYPAIGSVSLPSDALLRDLQLPVFRFVFQAMIFAALLESGTGLVNAVLERISHDWRRRRGGAMPKRVRLAVAAVLMVIAIVIAQRFGLVTLIARGYRLIAIVFLCVYVAPVLTLGAWRVVRSRTAAIDDMQSS